MASKEEWAELIREYESSGLTQADFARKKKINHKSFQNACYRYRKNRKQDESSFVPVVVSRQEHPMIRISINHVSLEFDPDICDDHLQKVIKAVLSL